MTIRTCALLTAGLLATFVSRESPGQSAASLTVVRYELVSSARVDRTRFDYVYRVVFRNPTTSVAAEAVATVTSASPASVVIDATVALGDVQPQAEALSSDTFTLRQDRTIAFNPANLVWNVVAFPVSGAVLPPHPGPAGELTLEGVDQNQNGVRDDLERFILTRHASVPARNALFQYAGLFQEALAATNTTAATEVKRRQILNSVCLSGVAGGSAQSLSAPLLARALNTLPRARRFFEYDALTGGLYALPPPGNASAHCPTGPF